MNSEDQSQQTDSSDLIEVTNPEPSVPVSTLPVNDPALTIAPKKSRKKILLMGLALATIAALAGTGGWWIGAKNKGQTQTSDTPSAIKKSEAIGAPIAEPTKELQSGDFIEPTFLKLAVVWQKPEKIGLQGLYKNEQANPEKPDSAQYEAAVNYVDYYLSGTFDGGKIIYGNTMKNDGPGRSYDVFIVKNDGSKAVLLKRYGQLIKEDTSSESYQYSSYNPSSKDFAYNAAKVDINERDLIEGTWAPVTITINGQKFSIPSFAYNPSKPDGKYSNNVGSIVIDKYDDPTTVEKVVSKIPEGTIYEHKRQKDGYYLGLFELELPNFTRVSYKLDGEISNNKIQPITWSDGSSNTASYESFGYGCGKGYYSLIADLKEEDLKQVGTSKSGQKIYNFKNTNQKVAATIKSEVNGRNGAYIQPDKDPPLTDEEYANGKVVIIVQDGMDRWVIFKNTEFFIQGGCGKPVIYLYPTSDTLVDVEVGADVTISEPHYPAAGWKNVLARPNGSLTYMGTEYGSLFWEGQGHGDYPDLSRVGVVVAYDQVINTMRTHLNQQGFNEKESQDFIDFWSLNIPNKPFVRLSWLTTEQTNILAPLKVSPKPDTVIRTFLEMEGLEQPVELKPQTYRAPPRNGFTVTEWGGLAINGLSSLKYTE